MKSNGENLNERKKRFHINRASGCYQHHCRVDGGTDA
jgi:hypothetical protein